jgi:hypothetical protein
MNTIVTFKWGANINTPFPSRNPRKISNIHYDGNYINNNYNNIGNVLKSDFKYICVTDNSEGISKEIEIVPVWDYLAEYGGCLRRLYCYSEEAKELFGEKFLTFDLDTVWINDFSHLFEIDADFVLLRSKNPEISKSKVPYRIHPGNGIISPGKYSKVWKDIQGNTLEKVTTSRRYFTGTDQSYFNYHYMRTKPNLNIKFLTVGVDGFYEALSLGRLPDNAICVLFSGPRDPNQPQMRSKFPWIKDYLK